QDLFRSRLDQIIDMKHALVKLARAIDWGFLEQTFGAVYTDKPGQPPLPTRLMAGLAILKHTYDLSDEALCDPWVEKSVLPVLLRRGGFSTCVGVLPVVADARGPADGAREAQGAAAGELGGGDRDGRDEALRQPGARAAGATDEEARTEPAPILCAGRQVGSDQTPALRPCSSIQARQPELTQAQDLSRPCHPRHQAANRRE